MKKEVLILKRKNSDNLNMIVKMEKKISLKNYLFFMIPKLVIIIN